MAGERALVLRAAEQWNEPDEVNADGLGLRRLFQCYACTCGRNQ